MSDDGLDAATREVLEATEAVGLVDEPGVVNVFAFPPDADPEAVAEIGKRLSAAFDDAKMVMMTGDVDADMAVDSMSQQELDAMAASRVRDVGQ